MEEKFFFSKIEEGRENYFVEYSPPISGVPFATLQLTFPTDTAIESVAHFMEQEGHDWIFRYPIPVMVSAFGSAGELIHLNGVRPDNHYTVYLAPGTREMMGFWCLLKNDEMPKVALDRDSLAAVYLGLPFRTSGELKANADAQLRKYRLGWYVVFVWAVVALSAFLVLEYFGPQWLATAVFLYGLYKATEKALKMTGQWKKSAHELAKEEDERLMRHHHYHCLNNPEGFLKLKVENFAEEQRADIRREAEALNVRETNS